MQAYKRFPALENSTWYKGILVSQLAGGSDTGGAFDLVESKMKKGTEPPPHIHDREDELFSHPCRRNQGVCRWSNLYPDSR